MKIPEDALDSMSLHSLLLDAPREDDVLEYAVDAVAEGRARVLARGVDMSCGVTALKVPRITPFDEGTVKTEAFMFSRGMVMTTLRSGPVEVTLKVGEAAGEPRRLVDLWESRDWDSVRKLPVWEWQDAGIYPDSFLPGNMKGPHSFFIPENYPDIPESYPNKEYIDPAAFFVTTTSLMGFGPTTTRLYTNFAWRWITLSPPPLFSPVFVCRHMDGGYWVLYADTTGYILALHTYSVHGELRDTAQFMSNYTTTDGVERTMTNVRYMASFREHLAILHTDRDTRQSVVCFRHQNTHRDYVIDEETPVFLADGARLMMCSRAKIGPNTVRVWDMVSGEEVRWRNYNRDAATANLIIDAPIVSMEVVGARGAHILIACKGRGAHKVNLILLDNPLLPQPFVDAIRYRQLVPLAVIPSSKCISLFTSDKGSIYIAHQTAFKNRPPQTEVSLVVVDLKGPSLEDNAQAFAPTGRGFLGWRKLWWSLPARRVGFRAPPELVVKHVIYTTEDYEFGGSENALDVPYMQGKVRNLYDFEATLDSFILKELPVADDLEVPSVGPLTTLRFMEFMEFQPGSLRPQCQAVRGAVGWDVFSGVNGYSILVAHGKHRGFVFRYKLPFPSVALQLVFGFPGYILFLAMQKDGKRPLVQGKMWLDYEKFEGLIATDSDLPRGEGNWQEDIAPGHDPLPPMPMDAQDLAEPHAILQPIDQLDITQAIQTQMHLHHVDTRTCVIPLRVSHAPISPSVSQFYDGERIFSVLKRDHLDRPDQGWDPLGRDIFHQMPIELACPLGPEQMVAVLDVNGRYVVCLMASPEVSVDSSRYMTLLSMAAPTSTHDRALGKTVSVIHDEYLRPKEEDTYSHDLENLRDVKRLLDIFGALPEDVQRHIANIMSETKLKGLDVKDTRHHIGTTAGVNYKEAVRNFVLREKAISDQK